MRSILYFFETGVDEGDRLALMVLRSRLALILTCNAIAHPDKPILRYHQSFLFSFL